MDTREIMKEVAATVKKLNISSLMQTAIYQMFRDVADCIEDDVKAEIEIMKLAGALSFMELAEFFDKDEAEDLWMLKNRMESMVKQEEEKWTTGT